MHAKTTGAVCLMVTTLFFSAPLAGASAQPAHYLVFEVDGDDTIRPVFSRIVSMNGLARSMSAQELDARIAQPDAVAVRLLRPDGEVAYRSLVDPDPWIRGEFHGEPDGFGKSAIESHRFPAAPQTFVVRVPVIDGASLALDGSRSAIFDLDALRSEADRLKLARWNDIAAPPNGYTAGSSGNRMDLLIMGDGYTSAQQTLFAADAASLASQFFGITPYAEYENFVTTTQLFTASPESGADHPPYMPGCTAGAPSCCGDAAASFDPAAQGSGTFVDNAFGSTYCKFNIQRLLTANTSAVLAAASAVPDWDKILVLINDGEYGGAGGSVPTTSTHPSAVGIARHEFGHSFTGLADEYETPFPGYPSCSDVSASSCEPNVTDETIPGLIKWGAWIEPSTPIPTPDSPTYATDVGLFEGARYLSSGVYRPRRSCLMRTLGAGFGEVCAQAYVLRLYEGGWGVPSDGIDPIEPASESPAPGPVATSGSVAFSVDLLQPVGAPALDITWMVDGDPQAPSVPPGTFLFNPPGAGTYTIDLLVEDTTPLVHRQLGGDVLRSSRSWTVESDAGTGGAGEIDSLRMAKSGGSLVELTWNPSCSPEATDYAVYEGRLGNFYTHTSKSCSDAADGVSLSELVAAQQADSYYLVVPLETNSEGSYGRRSTGTERPTGLSACEGAQQLGCP